MRRLLALATAVLLCGAPAVAQQGAGPVRVDPRRAALERQFRQRGEALVRRYVGLDEAQMARLRAVNRRYEQQRHPLLVQERGVRLQLRAELARGNAADQQHVAALMAQLRDLQARRHASADAEQREIATFLTPVQQARLYGLQAQLRERLRRLRAQAADSAPPAP